MTTREALLAAIEQVRAGRAQETVYSLEKMINGGEGVADACFLLGVLAYLHGDADRGKSLITRSYSEGKQSADFFYLFSQLLAPYGEAGERVRLILQQQRLMPLQYTGALTPEALSKAQAVKANLDQVEPWYFSRKMTNFFPARQSQFEGDHRKLIRESVLQGWAPAAPKFTRQSRILTMGSCFAEELRNYLREHDLWSDVMFVPPGLNNTFALRNFIEWCITGVASNDAYWYDETDAGKAVKWAPEEEASRYREVFQSIDALVLTIGLAEVWEDTTTGGVFWRGVPASIYNEDTHLCRLSSVEENYSNLSRIVELVKSINSKVEIIVTLSPVPLKATNQAFSCISADSISKSILRIAIHQLIEQRVPGVNYWPSFEIVRWLGSHVNHTLFGEDGNTRHVNRSAVKMILDDFVAAYFSLPSEVPVK